jgi:hypothetical protein
MSTYREDEPGPPPESDRYPEPGPYGPVADPPPGACRCGLPTCRSGWPRPEAQVRDDGDMGAGR